MENILRRLDQRSQDESDLPEGAPRPPTALLAGRRALDGRPGISILQDLRPISEGARWVLKLRLEIDVSSGDVPQETDWYMQVDAIYPQGSLELWPARINGIRTTFPHQNANIEPREPMEEQPWRNGRLCVDEADVHVGGERLIRQERSTAGKMLWHCDRARAWLRAAVDRTLLGPGDPYEPPHYATTTDRCVSYSETPESLTWWLPRLGTVGDILVARSTKLSFFVLNAVDDQDHELTVPWSVPIIESEKLHGCWLAFPRILTVHEHAAPHTWGEFRKAAAQQDLILDKLLAVIIGRARRQRSDFLLHVGYPIPKITGDAPVEMRFQTLLFPPIRVERRMDNASAVELLKRNFLSDNAKITWLETYNMAPEHLAPRGELRDALANSNVALIGGGALGALVAEQLVRMGLRNLAIADADTFRPPNIRRHLLTLQEFGERKAEALAQRLRMASPYTDVFSVQERYPRGHTARVVAEADVVVDCSAADEILAVPPPINKKRWCFSFSLGANAEKLFAYGCYSNWFNYERYYEVFGPFLDDSNKALDETSCRDTGCYNPVFPSPFNRIVVHSGNAVEFMNRMVDASGEPTMEVFSLPGRI